MSKSELSKGNTGTNGGPPSEAVMSSSERVRSVLCLSLVFLPTEGENLKREEESMTLVRRS